MPRKKSKKSRILTNFKINKNSPNSRSASSVNGYLFDPHTERSHHSHAWVDEHSYEYDHRYDGAEQYASDDALHSLLAVDTQVIVTDISGTRRVGRRCTALLLDGRYIRRIHHYNTSQTTGTASIPRCCCCWWWWISGGSSSIIPMNSGRRWIGRSLRRRRYVVVVQLVVLVVAPLEVLGVLDEHIFEDVFEDSVSSRPWPLDMTIKLCVIHTLRFIFHTDWQ